MLVQIYIGRCPGQTSRVDLSLEPFSVILMPQQDGIGTTGFLLQPVEQPQGLFEMWRETFRVFLCQCQLLVAVFQGLFMSCLLAVVLR